MKDQQLALVWKTCKKYFKFERELVIEKKMKIYKFFFFGFYGISTFVGYLMPYPFSYK